ncbi:MAG: penicillin-binding protein 2 [Marinifilaceae bacterium]|jgi:penicillin-binding protein 2|nr:penicillin-binding protein 2 [Marinifilaceae bacterium]
MQSFSTRKYVIIGCFIAIALTFTIRLLNLQIIDKTYRISAENNSQHSVTQYPARGLIYDRHGNILVQNQAAYDLRLTPKQLKSFDTLALCQLIGIDKEILIKKIKKAKAYSYRKSSIILKHLSSKRYAFLQEKLYKFPGFYVQARTLRKYPEHCAAHTLGYLNEVSKRHLKDKYYKPGDYIGYSGIEKSYEEELRGKKGRKVFWVDVYNRIKGSYKDGRYDTEAKKGEDIISTIDINLQKYGEKIMANKKGGIVAIEPSTGEILAKVSSPGYDPEMFVGRSLGKNYMKLQKDSLNPLFDRTLMAQYPPGSIFKLVQALIGLQEEVITPKTYFECYNGYHVGRFTMGCHSHHTPLSLVSAIQQSCNSYFAYNFRYILENPKFNSITKGYSEWRKYVKNFGFAQKLGSDLPHELAGNVPDTSYYQRKLRRKKFRSLNIISLSIGQGELLITPLQMANMTAAIANKGYFYTPHIIKAFKSGKKIPEKFLKKNYTGIDSSHFNVVHEGMEKVITGGEGSTGTLAVVPDIRVCGKTGTVQNPHGDDHSVFVAFAPRENPKIALIVYVENGVWGSRYGAPIAGLMIEKYIRGYISESKKAIEKRMLDANLLGTRNDK